MRSEIDDLFLVHAKDAQNPAGGQQRQMSERAEGAVADQHVAGRQIGMDVADPRQVVRPQRCGDDAEQQPRGGVEHRQQVHDREAAAGLLRARLTELFLQRRGVGHRHAGAIDQKGPMAVPAAVVERRAAEKSFADRTQQALKDSQRQTLACLAVGFAGAVHRAQPRHMGARGVAGRAPATRTGEGS